MVFCYETCYSVMRKIWHSDTTPIINNNPTFSHPPFQEPFSTPFTLPILPVPSLTPPPPPTLFNIVAYWLVDYQDRL